MTTVREAAAVRHGIWVLCPAAGAAAAWGLEQAAAWITTLGWFPFQGVFRLVTDIPEPWATVAALVVGAVAGLVFAGLWAKEMLTVEVSPDRVALHQDDRVLGFDRHEVESAFADGKQLVLLSPRGTELARETSDIGTGKLAEAFTAQGYRWREADPFAAEFRLWVEHAPELAPEVNALFTARRKAVSKHEGEEAAELAREIRRRGVAVRDEKKRQYYRCAR
ncbi:YqeB family protein [Lentzea sp.]|uniref:YqeB family protein n=1 Tax=Lentzea sp. TaxID=56099 RepID=UPI002ED133B7